MMIKFFGIVTLVVVFCLQLSFQAPTEQRDTKLQELHDAVGSINQPIDHSDAILNRKKRQQQMSTFEAFNICLKNVAKDGLEFTDYLFCKYASGIVFPDVAELRPLGSVAIENGATEKIMRLESDDDTENVTTFDQYLKSREEQVKKQMKTRKNPKGFVLDEGEDVNS